MSNPRDCPNLEHWKMLLTDTALPAEREQYERHLESCPACQECLDHAAGLGSELQGIARQVGDPTLAPADPTLMEFLDRLHGKQASVPSPNPPSVPAAVRPRRGPRGVGLLVVLLLGVPGLAVALGLLAQQPPAPSQPEDFYQDFRGSKMPQPPLKLIGPDADTVVRPENEGLRITLPVPRPSKDPVGVALQFPLVGDFEITASYELLSAQRPATGSGLAVALNLAVHNPYKFTKLGRFVRPNEGNVYLAERHFRGPPPDTKWETEPTEARRGQLRVDRKGSTLRYFAADEPGNAFRQIYQADFGVDDIEVVRFIVNNNDSPAAVDARLVDLRIRSGFSSGPSDGSAGNRPTAASRWLMAALLIILGMVAVVLGSWLYWRQGPGSFSGTSPDQQGPAVTTEALTLRCPGCGKTLRVKASLAGKKVQCPQCGETVSLPPGEVSEASHPRPHR